MKAKIINWIAATFFVIASIVIPATGWSAEQAWEILDGLTPLPRSLTRLGDHYVAVPFVNRQEQLLAAVLFYATCDGGGCELQHRAGYAITNAQGCDVRLYVEPEESIRSALVKIQRLFAAGIYGGGAGVNLGSRPGRRSRAESIQYQMMQPKFWRKRLVEEL